MTGPIETIRVCFDSPPGREPSPASASCRGETLAELRSVLSRLPADVAAATVYYHLDGMTHAEVAELLGCSRRKVGYLLERAQQSLARLEQIA